MQNFYCQFFNLHGVRKSAAKEPFSPVSPPPTLSGICYSDSHWSTPRMAFLYSVQMHQSHIFTCIFAMELLAETLQAALQWSTALLYHVIGLLLHYSVDIGRAATTSSIVRLHRASLWSCSCCWQLWSNVHSSWLLYYIIWELRSPQWRWTVRRFSKGLPDQFSAALVWEYRSPFFPFFSCACESFWKQNLNKVLGEADVITTLVKRLFIGNISEEQANVKHVASYILPGEEHMVHACALGKKGRRLTIF